MLLKYGHGLAALIFFVGFVVFGVSAQERPAKKPVNAYYQEQQERVSRTPQQIDRDAAAAKRVGDLEEKVSSLQKELAEAYKRGNEAMLVLERRIASLEAGSATTGTILEGLPALGNLLALHEREFDAWRVNAEGVMELTNAQVVTFQKALDVEIEFRNNLTPDDDWAWKRQFSIAMHHHGLLQADHWSICRINNKKGGFKIMGRGQ